MLISVCSSRDSESILIGKHSHRQERQGRKELVDHLSPRFRKTVNRIEKWGGGSHSSKPTPRDILAHA